jgi:hypothetical protein
MVGVLTLSGDRTNVPSLAEEKVIPIRGQTMGPTEMLATESGATTGMIIASAIKKELKEKDFFQPTAMGIYPREIIEEETQMKTATFIPGRISLFLITSSTYLGVGLVVFVLSLFGSLHLLTGFIGLASGLGLFMTSILNYKEWRRKLVI